MESHNEIRQRLDQVWDANQKGVVDVIRKKWKLTQFTEMEIHTVCGILEVRVECGLIWNMLEQALPTKEEEVMVSRELANGSLIPARLGQESSREKLTNSDFAGNIFRLWRNDTKLLNSELYMSY